MDKPEKSLKQEGVPFGARMVFRAQHTFFLLMAICLLLTMPFAALWSFFSESGEAFVVGVSEVLEQRLERVKAHRARLIAMYRPATAPTPAPAQEKAP